MLSSISPYLGASTYPQGLRVRSVQTRSIDLAWDELESSQQNGIIAGYMIKLDCKEDSKSVEHLYSVENASITTFTVTKLLPGALCSVSIAAVDDDGYSGPSSPVVDITTLPEGVCIQVSIYYTVNEFLHMHAYTYT